MCARSPGLPDLVGLRLCGRDPERTEPGNVFGRLRPVGEPWVGDQAAPTGLRRKIKHMRAGPRPTGAVVSAVPQGAEGLGRWPPAEAGLYSGADPPPALGTGLRSRSLQPLKAPGSGLVPKALLTCVSPGLRTPCLLATVGPADLDQQTSSSLLSIWASSSLGFLTQLVRAQPPWLGSVGTGRQLGWSMAPWNPP